MVVAREFDTRNRKAMKLLHGQSKPESKLTDAPAKMQRFYKTCHCVSGGKQAR